MKTRTGLLLLTIAVCAVADEKPADPYAGVATVAIETDHLRMVVCPQIGGRITELVSKKTGVNHLLLDPRGFKAYRELDIGAGFGPLATGLFDVVADNGTRGYPGWVQCAPYAVAVDAKARAPSITATCRRGAIEITRKMTLAADAPRLTVEITYRNVGKKTILTGVNVRTEFTGKLGRNAPRVILPVVPRRLPPLVVLPVQPRRLGIFPRCKGLRRAHPAGGWILVAPDEGERLLFRYDVRRVEFVRGFTASAYAERMYAVTLEQRREYLRRGKSVSLDVSLEVIGSDADPDAVKITALSTLLRNMPALWKHPGGLSSYAPWGVVSLPKVIYARKRPWAREATEYGAGDDVRLRSTFTAFADPTEAAPDPLGLHAELKTIRGARHTAYVALPPGRSSDVVFPAAKIGALAGPFRCDYTIATNGARPESGTRTVRYHHRGDPAIPKAIQSVRSQIAQLSKRRGDPHIHRILPWLKKRLEYAENLYEIGDYRYRPFCHGRAREEAYGSSSDAVRLLADAVNTVVYANDPLERLRRQSRGYVFCYDLAQYGAKFTRFPDDQFAEKLAKLKTLVDRLEANPDATKDIGWYKALYLLARRAQEDGIRADDGDNAAAVRRMHAWIGDCLKRIAQWPDDGYRKGKFRFPYDGLVGFYTKHVERYRGYSVYIPSHYNRKTPRPVLIDPNSYGNMMPAWDRPEDTDPVTLGGAVEHYGYIHIFPGHTNTYSRSGNPEDVRRVVLDVMMFLKIDYDRMYCAGGSLNADATGNLANSMLETWAAVAPFSQGAQLWTKKTALLPRVNFQAGGEASVFSKGVRKYQQWGVYDPNIHRGGLYPGVGHCGMSRDMWQFVFEFFARHKRRPAPATRAADGEK